MAAPTEKFSTEEELDGTSVNWPRLLAEISQLLLWIAFILLFTAGIMLWMVKPPGESDLCKVETLGLQNATSSHKEAALVACHGLYTTVFFLIRTFSFVFVGIGMGPAVLIFIAWQARITAKPHIWHGIAAFFNLCGIAILWFPIHFFWFLAGGITAFAAPITAQWLAIYAVYFGTKALGHTPPIWMDIVYQGYNAIASTQRNMWQGTIASTLLCGVCILDLIRNIACLWDAYRPRFEEKGSEVCYLKRLLYVRCVLPLVAKCKSTDAKENGYKQLPATVAGNLL